jgi:uncharacterized surface protein with fasciclin (FAS1) repeats
MESNLTLTAVMEVGVAIGAMSAHAAGHKDIVGTVLSAGCFSTLPNALNNNAGLVATLKGPGPFTVFDR